MKPILEIAKQILLEQDDKLSVLRKAIGERLPVTINYTGPSDEVESGERLDIEPVVLGKNSKSGNLVIWAYVFKGVSKKGLPGWKMFRIDRIVSADLNPDAEKFELGSLPGYQKGKAPSAMRSLTDVEIFSPYWFEDDERFKPKPGPTPEPETPEVTPTAPETQIQPQIEPQPEGEPLNQPEDIPDDQMRNFDDETFNEITPKIKDMNGQKFLTMNDYQIALDNLYHKKEDVWKNYQRKLSGNVRPGEGTRNRFSNLSKQELDNLLTNNGIKVTTQFNELSESIRRIKSLINH